MAKQDGTHVNNNSTRETFSGPEGNSMYRKTVLDPTFIGETMHKGSEVLTTDVRHLFRDAPDNQHQRSKASWVGAIGWNVDTKDKDTSATNLYRIQKSEFRQEVERKAACHPKVI